MIISMNPGFRILTLRYYSCEIIIINLAKINNVTIFICNIINKSYGRICHQVSQICPYVFIIFMKFGILQDFKE
jgi:hypothetical protein